jgi:hypothetical protein
LRLCLSLLINSYRKYLFFFVTAVTYCSLVRLTHKMSKNYFFKLNKTNMKTFSKTKRINLALLLIMSLLMFQGCNLACSHNAIEGDGEVLGVTHNVSGFNAIDLRGMYNVVLTPGDKEELFIETDGNLHELISVEVEGNTLVVKTRRDRFIKPTKMNIHVYFIELNEITSGGASTISATASIEAQKFLIDLSGATNLELQLNVNELTTNASGASNILFTGNANVHAVSLSGAGKIKADELLTNSTTIKLSGAGSAYVFANDYLDAKISGVGSVYYAGDPDKKSIEKSGLGSVKKI